MKVKIVEFDWSFELIGIDKSYFELKLDKLLPPGSTIKLGDHDISVSYLHKIVKNGKFFETICNLNTWDINAYIKPEEIKLNTPLYVELPSKEYSEWFTEFNK